MFIADHFIITFGSFTGILHLTGQSYGDYHECPTDGQRVFESMGDYWWHRVQDFFTEFLPPSIKSSNPFDKFLTCQNVFNGLLSTSRNDFVRVFCLHAYLLRRSEYYLFVVSADLAYLGSEYYLFVVFTNLAYLFLDTLFLIYTHSWPYC